MLMNCCEKFNGQDQIHSTLAVRNDNACNGVTHLHVANEHDDRQKEVTKEHKILQRDEISDGKASPFVQVRY